MIDQNEEFKIQFDWQKGYYPEIKEILKQNLFIITSINVASEYEDTRQCTDFTIKIAGGDVAVRIRKVEEFHDFTVRSRSENGGKTEIDKIKEVILGSLLI